MSDKRLMSIKFKGIDQTYIIPTVIADDANNDGNVVVKNYPSEAYAQHSVDKANPHSVTAEQVGAAPATEVQGSYTITDAADLDATLTSIINSMELSSRRTIHVVYQGTTPINKGDWFMVVSKTADANYGSVEATHDYALGILKKYRSYYSGAWTDWVNIPNHGHTATEIGAVPTSRTINEKALSSNITLNASDVGAAPSGYGLGEAVYSLPANGALTFKFDPFRHVVLFTAQGTTAASRAAFLVNTYGNGGIRTNIQVLSGSGIVTCARLPESMEQENGVVLFNNSSDAYTTVSVLILQGHYPEVIEGNSGVTSAAFQEPINSGNISTYAAPAGYGLGEMAGNMSILDDCHKVHLSGWYHVKSGTTLNAPTNASGVLRADFYGWQYGTLTFYTPSLSSTEIKIFQKFNRADVWSDWVDVSPSAFAPSGYGLGETSTYCTDCNNASKNGWYEVDVNTANLPADGVAGTLFVHSIVTDNGTDIYQTIKSGVTVIQRYYSSWAKAWQPWEWVNPPLTDTTEYRTAERVNGHAVYKRRDANGYMQFRLDNSDTWLRGVPGSMPMEYGLGVADSAPYCADANTAMKNGWYNIDAATANGIGSGCIMRVDAWKDTWSVVQTAYTTNESSLYHTIRQRWYWQNKGWTEWEYVTPPMILGVEYRTTERWQGKAVYCKLVSLGTLPDSATSEKDIVFFAGPMAELVSVDVSTYAGSTWRTEDTRWSKYVYKDSAGAHIVIKATENVSGYSGFATFKYTKN